MKLLCTHHFLLSMIFWRPGNLNLARWRDSSAWLALLSSQCTERRTWPMSSRAQVPWGSGGGTGYAGYAPAYPVWPACTNNIYVLYICICIKKEKKSLGSQMTLYSSRKQEVRRPRRPVRGKVILGPSTFWLLSRSVDLLKKNLDPSIGVEESRFTEHAAPWLTVDAGVTVTPWFWWPVLCCLRSLVCSLQFARPRSHRGSPIHYFSLVKFNFLLFVLL